MMKVGFLSSHNYFDRTAWSGTLYLMYHSLAARKEIEVVCLGRPRRPTRLGSLAQRVARRVRRGARRPTRNDGILSALVRRQLAEQPCDVLFAPAEAWEAGQLKTDVPLVYLSDTTARLWREHYGPFASSEERTAQARMADAEASVIEKSSRIVYPSQWAADSAVRDYGASRAAVHVVPFGANRTSVPSAETVAATIAGRDGDVCRLLFPARNWQRKGGELALATHGSLIGMGIRSRLTLVGCAPPAGATGPEVAVCRFLDCNRPRDDRRLARLYRKSHFLLLPSRADCSPMVVGEAGAYGVPAIVTDVGGIPSMIEEGRNGFMLPLSASAADFAAVIARAWRDRARYTGLAKGARAVYDARLNWNAWAERVVEILISAASGVAREI